MAIRLYDVPAVLHSGYTNGFGIKAQYKGIPTGGPYLLATLIAQCISAGDVPILLWDSKTNRREYYPSYKASRSGNPKIRNANAFTYEFLQNSVMNSFKVPGYEADDLAFNIVEMYREQGVNRIELHTVDYDWAHNIVDSHQVLVPASAQVCYVTNENFQDIFSEPSTTVPLNSISAKKVFFGDSSDGISPYNGGRKTKEEMFPAYINYCKANGYNTRLSEPLLKFLKRYQAAFGEEDYKILVAKVNVIFPRTLEKPLDFSFETINMVEFKKYLSVTGCRQICKRLGLNFIEDMGSLQDRAREIFKSEGFISKSHNFVDKIEKEEEVKISRGGFE